MAFVTKNRKSYTVRHGITGQPLSRHKTRRAARQRRDRLHREHRPKKRNRGRSARRRWKMRM